MNDASPIATRCGGFAPVRGVSGRLFGALPCKRIHCTVWRGLSERGGGSERAWTQSAAVRRLSPAEFNSFFVARMYANTKAQ